jgi:drug/metabolite transporter (DMT)-like permease
MSTTRSEAFAPRDWGLLAATALIWGSSFLFIRIAVADMHPGAVAFLRLAFGVATLGAIAAARSPVPRSAWPRIAVVGLTWMAAPFYLYAVALQWIDSSLAGMLNGAVPLFTAAIAAGVARRLPGWRQMLGLAVGLSGVVAVSLPSVAGARATALGIALVLLSSFCYGIAVNVTAPLQKQYGTLPVIWRAQIVALFLLLPLGTVGIPASSFSLKSSVAVAALGALGTGIAFWAFVNLVGRVGSTRASVAVYFMSPVAIVMGAFVLREPVGISALFGTLLIIAGAWLVSRPDGARANTAASIGYPRRVVG